jgi:hypothetical protein
MRTVNEWTVDAVSALMLTLSLTILLSLLTSRVDAKKSAPVQAPNVALAHRAWAGGSSWSEVVPRLGITVVDTLATNTAKEKA